MEGVETHLSRPRFLTIDHQFASLLAMGQSGGFYILNERKIFLLKISKEEKDVISTLFPEVNIVRTMKQRSKRHTYYCEETKRAVAVINKMRNGQPIRGYPKKTNGGGSNER